MGFFPCDSESVVYLLGLDSYFPVVCLSFTPSQIMCYKLSIGNF